MEGGTSPCLTRLCGKPGLDPGLLTLGKDPLSVLTSLLRVSARPPSWDTVWLSVQPREASLAKRSHHRHSHPGGMKLVGCGKLPSNILHPIFFSFFLKLPPVGQLPLCPFPPGTGLLALILRTKLPSDGPPADNRKRAGVALGLLRFPWLGAWGSLCQMPDPSSTGGLGGEPSCSPVRVPADGSCPMGPAVRPRSSQERHRHLQGPVLVRSKQLLVPGLFTRQLSRFRLIQAESHFTSRLSWSPRG